MSEAPWTLSLLEDDLHTGDRLQLRGRVHGNGLSVEVELLDRQETETEFRWIIKWDGCVHYDMPSDCMGHLCSFGDWERVFRAGRLAFVMAVEAMGEKAENDAAKDLAEWTPENRPATRVIDNVAVRSLEHRS